jgi:hypothetical protein
MKPEEVQILLRILEASSTKELAVRNKLILDLEEIMSPGLLFKYARSAENRLRGEVKWQVKRIVYELSDEESSPR